MSRLYDRVMQNASEAIKEQVKDSVVIKIDNVFEYMWSMAFKNPSKGWKVEFPNLAPPFPKIFMESKVPLIAINEPAYTDVGIVSLGWLIRSEKLANGWFLEASVLCENDTGIHPFIANHFLLIGDDGVALKNGWKASQFVEMNDAMWDKFINQEHSTEVKTHYAFPYCLALCFMNCKNVTTTEHMPAPKVQHKRLINHKPSLAKYYTLEIDPMKKVLKSEGRVDEVGLQRALHICRGHFKDYSNGKGLFGKYKGLYWWDDTVRGSAEAGQIVKDYSINSPTIKQA